MKLWRASSRLTSTRTASSPAARLVRACSRARSADAVIAVEGSYGTLSEMALALAYHKPVISLASWTFAREGHEPPPIIQATDARDAVEKAMAAARASAGPRAEEVPAHGD